MKRFFYERTMMQFKNKLLIFFVQYQHSGSRFVSLLKIFQEIKKFFFNLMRKIIILVM